MKNSTWQELEPEDSFEIEGLVLRTYPSGEANLVIKLLTAEQGKLSLFARNARKNTKRFRSNLDTFDHGRFTLRAGRGSLLTIESFDSLHTFRTLRDDLHKLACGSLLCECCDLLIPEDGEPDQQSLPFLLLGLRALDEVVSRREIFRATFLTLANLLAHAGYVDSSDPPPPSARSLLHLMMKVEECSSRQLNSRTLVVDMLREMRDKGQHLPDTEALES